MYSAAAVAGIRSGVFLGELMIDLFISYLVAAAVSLIPRFKSDGFTFTLGRSEHIFR
jgi:hypothetical protein